MGVWVKEVLVGVWVKEVLVGEGSVDHGVCLRGVSMGRVGEGRGRGFHHTHFHQSCTLQ